MSRTNCAPPSPPSRATPKRCSTRPRRSQQQRPLPQHHPPECGAPRPPHGDLLTLSRIELKTQKFQFATYYVTPLLLDCIDTLRPVAAKKDITIEFDPGPADVEVFCDSESIHQVMTNLLDNAIKYTPEEGRITVAWQLVTPKAGSPPVVEISVQDTGIGIPAEDLPRLFERFYRVDKARSRELGGTGLGLAIVKHISRAHGSDVRVESVLNQGSVFRFCLPTEDLGATEHDLQSEFMNS